jgi:hypothetical protein
VRHLQSLRRSPAFTLAAVVSLALALGAATLTFGLAEAILLRPLPFPEEERLLAVQAFRLGNPDAMGFVSLPEVRDFSRLAAFASAGASRSGFGLILPGRTGEGAGAERVAPKRCRRTSSPPSASRRCWGGDSALRKTAWTRRTWSSSATTSGNAATAAIRASSAAPSKPIAGRSASSA